MLLAPILSIDTGNYMLAGYVVIFGSLLGYILSLAWRMRALLAKLSQTDHQPED